MGGQLGQERLEVRDQRGDGGLLIEPGIVVDDDVETIFSLDDGGGDVEPGRYGLQSIGHFGYFRPDARELWADGISWLKGLR